MIGAFQFENEGRKYSCTVETPRGARTESWWWFSVTGDQQRYAPFQEPPPANWPLLKLPNVTLTAHAAFATREASERLLRMALEILAEERRALG